MRSASSGVAWWANPVTRMATRSGWNSTRSSSRRRPSDPVPRFQSRTARSTGWLLANSRADSASGTAWTSTLRPDPASQSRNVAADGLLVVHDQDGFGHGTELQVGDVPISRFGEGAGGGFRAAAPDSSSPRAEGGSAGRVGLTYLRPAPAPSRPAAGRPVLERRPRFQLRGKQFADGRLLGHADLDQDGSRRDSGSGGRRRRSGGRSPARPARRRGRAAARSRGPRGPASETRPGQCTAGLLTITSNVWPATGPNRSPSRNVIRSATRVLLGVGRGHRQGRGADVHGRHPGRLVLLRHGNRNAPGAGTEVQDARRRHRLERRRASMTSVSVSGRGIRTAGLTANASE